MTKYLNIQNKQQRLELIIENVKYLNDNKIYYIKDAQKLFSKRLRDDLKINKDNRWWKKTLEENTMHDVLNKLYLIKEEQCQ